MNILSGILSVRRLQLGKIISVQPVPEYFSITWMLGSRCNYDCMYCHADWHDMTSRPHDLETLKTVWKNIYSKSHTRRLKYKISFTGGEVTANKNFLPLVEWLRSEYNDIAMILITTNGSASLNYYRRLSQVVESISFSVHSEHINEKDFFHKVSEINDIMHRPAKSVHVNIMDEFWNKDRIPLYQDWLDKRDISHSINIIKYEYQTRTFPVMKGTLDLDTNSRS